MYLLYEYYEKNQNSFLLLMRDQLQLERAGKLCSGRRKPTADGCVGADRKANNVTLLP